MAGNGLPSATIETGLLLRFGLPVGDDSTEKQNAYNIMSLVIDHFGVQTAGTFDGEFYRTTTLRLTQNFATLPRNDEQLNQNSNPNTNCKTYKQSNPRGYIVHV